MLLKTMTRAIFINSSSQLFTIPEDTKISMPSDHCSISENKRQKLSENLDKDVKRQSKQDRSRRKHTQIQVKMQNYT